jgi:hypothetical protein
MREHETTRPRSPDPYTLDILFTMNRVLGRLEEGMNRSLENDRELFQAVRDHTRRVAHLEALQTRPQSGQSLEERRGLLLSGLRFLSDMREVAPTVREIAVGAILVAIAALWPSLGSKPAPQTPPAAGISAAP